MAPVCSTVHLRGLRPSTYHRFPGCAAPWCFNLVQILTAVELAGRGLHSVFSAQLVYNRFHKGRSNGQLATHAGTLATWRVHAAGSGMQQRRLLWCLHVSPLAR